MSSNCRNLLDYIVGLNPASPPTSPPADEDFEPPSPSAFNFDAHFGYSPTPSPPPETANQLTQEQIDMGMFKVESGSGAAPGNMGPPQPVVREESVDTFKGRGAISRSKPSATLSGIRRKRKDRESDEETAATTSRKKTRG
jgi:hypothetical protein